MTNKDLISQYVDTGMGIPRYQYDKLSNNDKKTYLRKIEMSIESKIKQFEEYDEDEDNNLEDNYNSLDLDFLDYHYGILPDRIQTDLIYYNPLIIKNIKNPCEKVQLIAVKSDARFIKDIIKNGGVLSEKLQLDVVNRHGNNIVYIENPSEAVQLAAVNKDGEALRLIINKGIVPSDAVQMAAIKQNGDMIFYLKFIDVIPSEEQQLAAIQQQTGSLRHIKNPTKKVQLTAVNKDGRAISYIKNPSEEVQLAAINNHIYAIKNIKTPTEQAIALHNKLYIRRNDK